MRVRPSPGVTASVRQDGQLELNSELTGRRHHCGWVGTAMWIALVQHDGESDRAADFLARMWDTDPSNMRADLDLWVDELCVVGLTTKAP